MALDLRSLLAAWAHRAGLTLGATQQAPRPPKAMLADIERSGLTAADVTALGWEYRERDDAGNATPFGMRSQPERPQYVIRYTTLDGRPNGFHRVRFLGALADLPRDKRGRPIRYSQPEGSGCHVFYAHLGEFSWKKIAKDAGAELWITEGEKKAAALCKLGVPCLGLGGVWNFFEAGAPVDDLNHFAWTGRVVRIAFDSDARHKTSVQLAVKRLADELIKRGAIPFEIELPTLPRADKTGLDDFLVHHGGGAKAIKALRALPERSLLMPAGSTFAELATKQLPAQRWVIKDLLPAGASIAAGKPKMGKSWLMLELAVAVATGGKALGFFEAQRGGVLHLALEDTERRFQDRLKRMLDGAEPPASAHFFNSWRRVEDHGLTALRRWLDAHPDTRLIVIDTLAKMRPAMSAKDHLYRVDYDAIDQLKRIADEYSAGVVIVHHERKATADDHIDRVSGSTGLTGAADTIFTLSRERGQMDAVLSVTGRDVAEQDIALSMDQRTMRWQYRGDADDFRISQERRKIIEVLTALGHAASPSEVAPHVGRQRHAVNKSMLAMTQQGLLTWLPGGKYELVKKGHGKT
jgi:hypothetical protein